MCILIIDQLFLSQQPSPFVLYNHGSHLASREKSILGIGIPKIRGKYANYDMIHW